MPNKVRKNGKKVLFEEEIRGKKRSDDEILEDEYVEDAFEEEQL